MLRCVRVLAVALLALTLVACGDDDASSPDTTAPPGTPTTADPTPETSDDPSEETGETPSDPTLDDDAPSGVSLIGMSACDLLDAGWLAENVSFENGSSMWEERSDADPNRCQWFSESNLMTLTVSLTTYGQADLDGRRENPTDGTTVEELAISMGAFAVRDDVGERYFQVWVPLGAAVLSVIVDVMHLTDEEYLSIVAEVMANSPAG